MRTIHAQIGDTVDVLLLNLRRPQPAHDERRAKALGETRTILTAVVELVTRLRDRVYEVQQQAWMRPDRHCTVEVGLLADLTTLSDFVGNFTSGAFRLGEEGAVSYCHPCRLNKQKRD